MVSFKQGLKFNNIKLINKIFDQSGIDTKENVIFCYSGLESSISWFVFHELMQKKSSKLLKAQYLNGKLRINQFIKNSKHNNNSNFILFIFRVAQLVEHATENRSVGGSIPPLWAPHNLMVLPAYFFSIY